MTQTRQLFSGDPRLRYTDTGKGHTLLLLHGVTRAQGTGVRCWSPLRRTIVWLNWNTEGMVGQPVQKAIW